MTVTRGWSPLSDRVAVWDTQCPQAIQNSGTPGGSTGSCRHSPGKHGRPPFKPTSRNSPDDSPPPGWDAGVARILTGWLVPRGRSRNTPVGVSGRSIHVRHFYQQSSGPARVPSFPVQGRYGDPGPRIPPPTPRIRGYAPPGAPWIRRNARIRPPLPGVGARRRAPDRRFARYHAQFCGPRAPADGHLIVDLRVTTRHRPHLVGHGRPPTGTCTWICALPPHGGPIGTAQHGAGPQPAWKATIQTNLQEFP